LWKPSTTASSMPRTRMWRNVSQLCGPAAAVKTRGDVICGCEGSSPSKNSSCPCPLSVTLTSAAGATDSLTAILIHLLVGELGVDLGGGGAREISATLVAALRLGDHQRRTLFREDLHPHVRGR